MMPDTRAVAGAPVILNAVNSDQRESGALRRAALSILAVVLLLFVLAAGAGALYDLSTHNDSAGLALASVAASLMLALAASLALRQNVELIRATAREAEASRTIADEMRRDRELSFKPALTVRFVQEHDTAPNFSGIYSAPAVPKFIVKNIGTGPAFNLNFCGCSRRSSQPLDHIWISDERQGLATNEEWRIFGGFTSELGRGAVALQRGQRFRCVVDDLLAGGGEVVFAVRYDDWFGKHYRSPGGPEQSAPTEWDGTQGTIGQPDWMRCQG
jgi:hypothetical protein